MIKLVLFDVGETLLHNGAAFPHVQTALEAIRHFTTAAGEPLTLGIVSDYFPPSPPPTEAKIAALEAQFLQILTDAGLASFFEPLATHITLSSRAGVNKPERAIFEMAVQRSGTGATLPECLFVTENQQHLQVCRDTHGMTVLRYGTGPGLQPAFADWAEAPGRIAALVAPDHAGNLTQAVAAFLAARHGLSQFRSGGIQQLMQQQQDVRGHHERSSRLAVEEQPPSTIDGQAQQLVQLKDDRLGPLSGVYVSVPTEVSVRLDAEGQVAQVDATPPSREAVADALEFVAGLVRQHRVALPESVPPGATHAVEEDAGGKRRLVRRRFARR